MFKWMKENFKYENKYKNAIINNMNISVICIQPDDIFEIHDWDLFINEYSKRFDKGEIIPTICEYMTPIFPLFMDLDYVFDHYLNDNEITFHLKMIQKNIKLIYEKLILKIKDEELIKKIFTFHVLRSPPKDKGNNKIKSGVHIIFPFLFVNSDIAREICIILINNMNKSMDDMRWDTIIDLFPFSHNSLRMPFANKKKILTCNDKCNQCDGNRLCVNLNYYNYSFSIDGMSNKIVYNMSSLDVLKNCTIRLPDVDILTPFFELKINKIIYNENIWKRIFNLINEIHHYEKIIFKNIVEIKNGYKINCYKRSYQYCYINGATHDTCIIYFIIKDYKIYQHCTKCYRNKYKLDISEECVKNIFQENDTCNDKILYKYLDIINNLNIKQTLNMN